MSLFTDLFGLCSLLECCCIVPTKENKKPLLDQPPTFLYQTSYPQNNIKPIPLRTGQPIYLD